MKRNQQSCVEYIFNYKYSKDDHPGQTQEQHVTDQLSNFQLNPTVNEPEN